ncbi:MAG: alpha/beta hydrolase, partial [Flavisolibacter sp.]|nr:alpha/beta hydrolase [Flavisolibacter sp.]
DVTPPQNVSIDVYRDKVLAAINNVSEKVILVGHSMGGMVISAVAEKAPDKIEKLVFIGAYVPTNGQSLLELAGQDHQSILGASIVPSADQLTLNIKRDSIVAAFCHDAPQPTQQEVVSKFRVEPAIPFTNKVTITDDGFGRVDKYYIHTLQDRAIGIDLQHSMASAARITKTYSVNTSHSPFLSQPAEVVRILKKISK